ncbi:MAG: bifunctional adenosylcobinamide kinase/adenosylcobinamide-phosphate guanylyltransferase [Alsobacter sp.]
MTAISRLSLILGGARSGKSRHAEAMVTASPGPWHYVATGQGLDDEMVARISRHRADRAQGWITTEEPLALAEVLARIATGPAPVLVDCLTLWLTNVMLDGRTPEVEADGLLRVLADLRGPVVLVANEVGLGIVPDNALGRAFRDAAGRLNQQIAARADRVVFVAAGLPLVLKG